MRDWREVLVAAALAGHKQIRGIWHDRYSGAGECAFGVLHLELHETRKDALDCYFFRKHDCFEEVKQEFGLCPISDEGKEIIHRNDTMDQDFLTIARKACRGDETLS